MRLNPKTAITLAATLIALAIPSVASANQTVTVSGFNCSVTAYTPTRYVNGEASKVGTSCGGAQANYSKRSQVTIMQLIPGGWSVLAGTTWDGWTSSNPDQLVEASGPCVPGRWYATLAQGEVNHGGVDSLVTANTYQSGWQCP